MSRVTVVSPTEEFRSRIADALGDAADVSKWWDEALMADTTLSAGTVGSANPSVVVIADVGNDDSLALARALSKSRPEIGVLLMTDPTPDLYAQAMRAGVLDIVAPDSSSRTIQDRIGDALQRSERLKAKAAGEGPLGSVVTIIEPKGGAGKTSIIANMAIVMAQRFPGEVVLIDLDLQFGDLTETLLLNPRYTFADVARSGGALDATALKAFLTKREGLFVLAAPGEPELADDITPDQVTAVIELLRPDFRWILVDTAGGMNEHTLAAVERSTDLILLSSLDVLANKSMRKTQKILDNLGVIAPRRHLVLNRSDSRVGLDRTEAIMELGMRRAVEIPSSRAMPTSLNRGQPIVETSPRAGISRRIADLAEELIAAQAATEEWKHQ